MIINILMNKSSSYLFFGLKKKQQHMILSNLHTLLAFHWDWRIKLVFDVDNKPDKYLKFLILFPLRHGMSKKIHLNLIFNRQIKSKFFSPNFLVDLVATPSPRLILPSSSDWKWLNKMASITIIIYLHIVQQKYVFKPKLTYGILLSP